MDLFIDKRDNEWKIGKCPISGMKSKDSEIHFILPFLVDAMYPSDYSELIYSNCCKCGDSIEKGLIVITFENESAWGIRICCQDHYKDEIFSCDIPIISVLDILEPIISKGCETEYIGCVVCDRPKCKEIECVKILKMNILEKDTLFDHFYKIRLNVYSPFVEPICGYCKRINVKKKCKECKLYVFCDSRCRNKHKHRCSKQFYDIWRS